MTRSETIRACFIPFLGMLAVVGCNNSPAVVTSNEATVLFLDANGSTGSSIRKRLEAVQRLGSMREAADWQVMILQHPQSLNGPMARSSIGFRDNTSIGFLGALIKSLPADAHPAVLWVLSEYASGMQTGYLVLEPMEPGSDEEIYVTGQIAELARQKLVENLGVDHGDWIDSWRIEIAKRKAGVSITNWDEWDRDD